MMATAQPRTDIDSRFSSPEATPTPWVDGIKQIEEAGICWLTTVRPDGRPHVTPLASIWYEGAFYFCTGASERKTLNLAQNQHVVVTTGCNLFNEGLDVVIEGDAVRVTDQAKLQRFADQLRAKYGSFFDFQVREGGLSGGDDDDVAPAFEVAPKKAFGFTRGEQFSQTRWQF
jgi:nitroimidazol reductase NimA-like FMN-containing flavoprotein (pyridoxamine 5'-phosphate oxidase superfamily)